MMKRDPIYSKERQWWHEEEDRKKDYSSVIPQTLQEEQR